MREILFRGKRLDNGEWIYGGYFKHNNRQKCVIGDSDKPEDFDDLIFVSGFADWNMPRPLNYAKVDPNTVGQFTGVCDKNGKKIFEGDIVKLEDRLCVITWLAGNAQFDLTFLKFYGDIRIVNFKGVDMRDLYGYEVIGNIYDNPELLEAKPT